MYRMKSTGEEVTATTLELLPSAAEQEDTWRRRGRKRRRSLTSRLWLLCKAREAAGLSHKPRALLGQTPEGRSALTGESAEGRAAGRRRKPGHGHRGREAVNGNKEEQLLRRRVNWKYLVLSAGEERWGGAGHMTPNEWKCQVMETEGHSTRNLFAQRENKGR